MIARFRNRSSARDGFRTNPLPDRSRSSASRRSKAKADGGGEAFVSKIRFFRFPTHVKVSSRFQLIQGYSSLPGKKQIVSPLTIKQPSTCHASLCQPPRGLQNDISSQTVNSFHKPKFSAQKTIEKCPVFYTNQMGLLNLQMKIRASIPFAAKLPPV